MVGRGVTNWVVVGRHMDVVIDFSTDFIQECESLWLYPAALGLPMTDDQMVLILPFMLAVFLCALVFHVFIVSLNT